MFLGNFRFLAKNVGEDRNLVIFSVSRKIDNKKLKTMRL